MKKLISLAILLILLGSLLIALAFHSGKECASQYTEVKLSFARALEVQNGGEVEAYVLAVDAPTNAGNILVVNDPDGTSYVFARRNGLFYPPKPVSFKNLYVENLSWRTNITVYAVSGDYAGFLNVSGGRFIIGSPVENFGGIAFICNRPFVFNVSDPRGTVYGDDGKVLLVLKNDSFKILNETYRGTPLLLEAGCNQEQDRVGYTLLYRNPFGGYISYSGVLDESILVLGKGFSFKELEARQRVIPLCPRSPGKTDVLSRESPLWDVLMIVLGLLLIGVAVRRPYKPGKRGLKR
ncbi:hypothetical protein [Thermococcus sp.]|uniref:hypothetical protein n=1 Tax=Thermococcus sp. TaxID=35749 RepID=UPI002607284E|nr:hypothetical protein [Thermococcus sp.]